MTRPRPGSNETAGLAGEPDPTADELARYANLTAGESPHGLADRVMSAVSREPTPRRGILATLLGPFALGADNGMLRMGLVAGTMALAVLAVIVAGRLGDLFLDQQIGPSPPPSVIVSPVVSPSPTATPTPAPSRTPRPSPRATPSDDASGSPATESPDPTGSDGEDDSSGTGSGEDDGPETPRPSEDSSGSEGGDE